MFYLKNMEFIELLKVGSIFYKKVSDFSEEVIEQEDLNILR